jgi:hypothetical protein
MATTSKAVTKKPEATKTPTTKGKPVVSKPPVKEEPKKLFTTKNVVLGVAVLAIGYFVYKKYIKRGKK